LSCIDRSASVNDSELNVESLIKNLKNRITPLLNSVEIFNIVRTFTLTNSFRMINSYQPILWYLLFNFMMQMKDIHVFRNRNMNVILFYTHR
ncbi:uncharacterized protein BDCG_17896, partial [Blastomyces dermatitidis ER-3]